MEDRHTKAAQLDKDTVELTLRMVLTRPRWIFKKETAVVIRNIKAAHIFVIIFGSTLSLCVLRTLYVPVIRGQFAIVNTHLTVI